MITYRLPKTLSTIESRLGYDSTAVLRKYVMCTTCHSLYLMSSDSTIPDNCEKQTNARPICNNPLYRKRNNSTIRGRPYKVYAYSSIIASLEEMFMRKGFEEDIEQWRNRDYSDPDVRSDVYDGAQWKEFVDKDGKPFVDEPRSLLATISVDWFSPFSSTTTKHNSVGAIYLSINNIPRHLRLLPCNVLFLGCLPGPKEPQTVEIDNYMKPIVDELLPLFEGVDMVTYSSNGKPVKVRLALLNLAADSPASRKCSGFLSYRSFHLCIPCDHLFKHTDNTSGIDLSKPGPFRRRQLSDVRRAAEKWRSCTDDKQRDKLEKETGVRNSELYRLSYWNPIRQVVYDPFHVILLGVCKRMVEVWTSLGFFNASDYCEMQEKADSITLPLGFEDLGQTLQSQFSYMTGSRWKTWLLIVSPYVLFGVLPTPHYKLWMDFVDACRYLLKPSINLADAHEAHKRFLKFYKGCVRLYAKCVTSNFHFLLHFYDQVKDYGPVYSVWLLPYERFNKLLKNITINGKDSFEVTMMTTFLKRKNAAPFVEMMEDATKNEVVLTESYADFLKGISSYTKEYQERRHGIPQKSMMDFYKLSSPGYDLEVTGAEDIPLYQCHDSKLVVMDSENFRVLTDFYRKIGYKDSFDAMSFESLPYIHIKSQISIAGQVYNSTRSTVSRGSFISTYFDQSNNAGRVLYPGIISYFFEHTPLIDGKLTRHVFCFVRWYKNVINNSPLCSSGGLEFWDEDFEELNELCILPVHKLFAYVAVVKFIPKIRNGRRAKNKMLIFPTSKKLFL